MKKIMKVVFLAVIFMFVSCFSKGTMAVSASEDINNIGTKVISDTNKVWTISFKSDVNISSLNNSVYVEDITDSKKMAVNISQGEDASKAKVKLASGSYKVNHKYKITVDKNAKSVAGKNLARVATLNFSVVDKSYDDYKVMGKVIVSPFSDVFKQITITSTNLGDAAKYSVEGSNAVADIGKPIPLIFPANEAKIILYDENKKVLGEVKMDVSSSKDNITMKVNILN